MGVKVDHHPPALHAGLGHPVHAEPPRLRRGPGAEPRRDPGLGAVRRPDHVLAGLKAVVVDRLGPAVGVGVEELPDMGEAVPLRRVLQMHDDEVV